MRNEEKRKALRAGSSRGNTRNVNTAQTQIFNTLSRNSSNDRGSRQKKRGEESRKTGFLEKRVGSVENALGTTGAALASAFTDAAEQTNMNRKLEENKSSLDNIAKKYGFDSKNSFWDAYNSAYDAGDKAKLEEFKPVVSELQAQTKTNAEDVDEAARKYKDYRENNYISNKINQDRGKFAGSAINTLSTAFDVLAPGAGIAANTVQGGVEGIADELEQNGLANFDIDRAKQNALIGATTGAVVGGTNKAISGQLAKNGGNLFKGNNAITRNLNKLGSSTTAGEVASTLATGAGRGAISGAVGGATGGGLGAALNNQDILEGILSGAQQGAQEGALVGAGMAGANRGLADTKLMQKINQAGTFKDWRNSGDNFNERLTANLTSGDSELGNWLMRKNQSKILGQAGNIGNRVQDVNTDFVSIDPLGNRTKYSADDVRNLIDEYENYTPPKVLSGNSSSEVAEAMGDAGVTLSEIYRRFNGGEFNPYSRADGEAFNKWVQDTKTQLGGDQTPSTLGGWLKQGAQRVAEDMNGSNLGMRVKDVSGDGTLNLEPGDKLARPRRKSISEMTDGEYKTIGDLMNDGMELSDIKKVLPKSQYETLLNNTREIAGLDNLPYEALDVRSKSDLPMLNREQYYEDTLGKVKGNDYVSYRDVPDYMKNHLVNPKDASQEFVMGSNDEILRTLFKDETSPISELYERYENLAQGANANEIYTPENINKAIALAGPEGDTIANNIVDRLFNGRRTINVDGTPSRAKNIQVKNQEAEWVADAPARQEEAVMNMIASAPDEYKLPRDIQNMAINDGTRSIPEAEVVNRTTPETPETEVFRALSQTQEPIDLTDAFADKGLGAIEKRNRLQSVGQQFQNAAQTQKYSGIYDSLDAKTAKRAAETGAPQKLADLGVRSQDYNQYAKTSSYVNRVVSDLAKKSGVKVNAPDLPSQLSADNIDVVMSDSALKKYNGYIKQIVPDGDSPTEYSASYLLEKSRELGNKAANLRGNTDDVTTLRQALTDAKYTLRDLATKALEGSNITGDGTNDMIANGLKNLGANEKVQDYYTEAVDGKAPSVSDYIRRSSLFEQARDMGNQIDAERYTRSASKAPANPATRIWRASGLDQVVEPLLKNTIAPAASKLTSLTGKALEGAGNIQAKVTGNGTTGNGGIGRNAASNAYETYESNFNNPATQLYNALGRTEGEIAGENRQANPEFLAARQRAMANLNNSTQNLTDQITDAIGQSQNTELYAKFNSAFGTPETEAQMAAQSTNPYFQATGDIYTDAIADALAEAIDNNDVELFTELYAMYEDALAKTQKSQGKDMTNPTNWASGDRTKLINAQNGLGQIDELERAYNTAVAGTGGTSNAFQGGLRSKAAELNSNWDPTAANYNNLAQSAGMGIVKNLVNLGVTEADAQRYLQYLPSLADTKEQAASKLQTLRSIYQNQIDNLQSLYAY